MSSRMTAILGTAVAAYIVAWLGIQYLFGPAMASDAPAGAMLPGWVSLGIIALVEAMFLDWINQSVGSPMKSAMIIAISQIMLVDVYYVMNGTRGVAAAGASIVVLLGMWGAAGVVYGKLVGSEASA